MTEITIADVPPEVEYIAAVSLPSSLDVPFAYFESDDVKVRVEDPVGTWTDKVRGVDWNFTAIQFPLKQQGQGNPAGNEISFFTTVSIGARIRIYRDTGIERLTELPGTGPINLYDINDEFNKIFVICQELESQKDKYIFLDREAVSTEPWDFSSRAAKNVGESSDLTSAATLRQVHASGPNWVFGEETENAVGANGAWQNIIASVATIQGNEDSTSSNYKKFDLQAHFQCWLQNRGGSEASFRVRVRHLVDCYSEVTKDTNQSYTIKVPATSSIPFSVFEVFTDLDYTNGNGTVQVSIDIYPMDANSADLYVEDRNYVINTSEPT